MKNLELKELGVQEMNTTEMSKIEGGGLLNDFLFNTVATVVLTVGILASNTVGFLGNLLNSVVNLIKS
jgi:hypothetical protein